MENPSQEKFLLAFDMDNTIIQKSADYEAMKLLPKSVVDELPEPVGSDADWAIYMQKVFCRMKVENIKIQDIQKAVEEIPLNEGFEDLFEFIRSKKSLFKSTIISGANELFVKWLVDKKKLNDIFPNYFSNKACPNDECLVNIKQYHTHSCTNCDRSICKKIVLEKHIKNIIEKGNLNDHYRCMYVGDGDNDYCPSTILKQKDFLFPRQDFFLYNMLYGKDLKKNLKCQISPWKDGRQIIKVLKKIV